jgi:hypothetical protein
LSILGGSPEVFSEMKQDERRGKRKEEERKKNENGLR